MSGFWHWAGEHWFITGLCFLSIAAGIERLFGNIRIGRGRR